MARQNVISKQVPQPKKRGRGRPKFDPAAPLPATLTIQRGTQRYGMGWDQIKEGLEAKVIPGISINGKWRIIRAKADELFGIVTVAG
jgi:hypothetical protein